MKVVTRVSATIGFLLACSMPLAVALGVIAVIPDAPAGVIVIATLAAVAPLAPLGVSMTMALSPGDPESLAGQKLRRKLIVIEVAIVAGLMIALGIGTIYEPALVPVTVPTVIVNVLICVAAPMVGYRLWRSRSRQPDHPAYGDLVSAESERSRRRRVAVWFAVGLGAGIIAVALFTRFTSSPPNARLILSAFTFPVVFGCMAATIACFRVTLEFQTVAASIAGQDSDSARRVQRAIMKGEDRSLSEGEHQRASHLAYLATYSLPWTYRQSFFLFAALLGIQLPGVLGADAGTRILAVVYIGFFAVVLSIAIPFARRSYRRLVAYSAAHPYVPAHPNPAL